MSGMESYLTLIKMGNLVSIEAVETVGAEVWMA